MSQYGKPGILQNNLMGTHTSDKFKEQSKLSSGFGAKNMLGELSEQSMRSHATGGQFMNAREEKKRQIAEEWGFEKEETMMLWEARQKKRQGQKKQKNLTADEKLKRFMQHAKGVRK